MKWLYKIFSFFESRKIKELKLKTEKELKQMLNEFRDKLRDLRFKDANKQLKNIREIRIIKKTIARIFFILSSVINQNRVAKNST